MTTPPLAPLSPLLAEEPALRAVVNRDAVVAVPDPARAIFLAALARASTRRPIVVAVPTRAEADRLTHDLAQFLPRDEIEEFPAWETLPFERVSPSVETMGRRLRVMWRLRTGQPPTILVAPARALLQRLGPHVEDVEPVQVRPGDRIDRDALVEQLVAMGYRREYQVEARGEVAVRGSIVDVYPSTDDHPLRIDLWDDEVDRLAAFSVADQRTTHDVDDACIFPARELLPTDEVRARAAALVRDEPWGATNWERLAEGLWFDGMESWLPWLTASEHLLSDLLDRDALVLVCEPRRLRDRGSAGGGTFRRALRGNAHRPPHRATREPAPLRATARTAGGAAHLSRARVGQAGGGADRLRENERGRPNPARRSPQRPADATAHRRRRASGRGGAMHRQRRPPTPATVKPVREGRQ